MQNAVRSMRGLPPVISVDDLTRAQASSFFGPNVSNQFFDGDKFFGGFGSTHILEPDYWTLRHRSAQLFTENLYARGLIRRLVSNEIGTGLTPEAEPNERVLGLAEGTLDDWAELVESRFAIYASSPRVCDHRQQMTLGELQGAARAESLISGDVLVILNHSQQTRLPTVQLVNGARVKSPLGAKVRNGNTIKHGVELDKRRRVVAYWILQDDNTFKRVPAFGEKSGRRLAWLVFGTDKRFDDVRGMPALALFLQSLREVDRYRDSVQRKALVNSMLALFIQKDVERFGTKPLSKAAVRKDNVTAEQTDGGSRTFSYEQMLPGVVINELQVGEKPVGFDSQGTDLRFADFERAIIQSFAWANEVPPEILTLAFSNNYSASQAAINEFKIYLNRQWFLFGSNFCQPIYEQWLVNEVLMRKADAPGMLEAWRNPAQFDIFGAWVSAQWYGSIKPSTDMLKQAKGSQLLLELGLTNYARESRILTGTNFAQNMRRQRREVEKLAEIRAPMREAGGEQSDGEQADALEAAAENVIQLLDEMKAENT